MEGFGKEPTRDHTDVIGARIGAQLVDTVVAIVIFLFSWTLLTVLFGGATDSAGGAIVGWLLGPVVGGFLVLCYFFILEGIWDGQTVGKKLLGIKVVKEDGSQCDISTSFVRNLMRILDFGIFYYWIGFLSMAFTDKRQRIGDLLAGSVVVRESDSPEAN